MQNMLEIEIYRWNKHVLRDFRCVEYRGTWRCGKCRVEPWAGRESTRAAAE